MFRLSGTSSAPQWEGVIPLPFIHSSRSSPYHLRLCSYRERSRRVVGMCPVRYQCSSLQACILCCRFDRWVLGLDMIPKEAEDEVVMNTSRTEICLAINFRMDRVKSFLSRNMASLEGIVFLAHENITVGDKAGEEMLAKRLDGWPNGPWMNEPNTYIGTYI